MSNGVNKESLIEFLFEEWRNSLAASYQGISVFIAHGYVCHALHVTDGGVNVVPVPSLRCDHEEADSVCFYMLIMLLITPNRS